MSKAQQTSYGSINKQYDDGVVVHGHHDSRWQKYGNDRIYPASAKEGYVDLVAGEVVGLEPSYDSGVGEYRMDYNDEKDALELVAVPRPEIRQRGHEETIIATIPTEVLA